jgi:outer membrane protein OmpA-like peptidoglycan-associated protein
LNFGRDAAFAVCIEPACPAVTRKTLAIQPQAPASASAPWVDISATLEPGEEEWKGQPNTADATVSPADQQRSPVVVTFASGSATLSDTARAALDHAASGVQATDHILIVGRTDNVGSKRTNHALALARARAVRDYLRARLPSHPHHAFTLDAQGACCFTASNDTPEGRRQNRRVEVVFRVSGQVAP